MFLEREFLVDPYSKVFCDSSSVFVVTKNVILLDLMPKSLIGFVMYVLLVYWFNRIVIPVHRDLIPYESRRERLRL